MSILVEGIIGVAINEAYQAIKKKFKNVVTFDESLFKQSLLEHVNYITNWSEEIKFSDLGGLHKTVTQTYIPIDYYITPRRNVYCKDDKTLKIEKIIGTNKHIVILGYPGAGKTTAMKNLCNKIFHDADFYPEIYKIPTLITFRSLNYNYYNGFPDTFLYIQLLKIIGLDINKFRDNIFSNTELNPIQKKNKLFDLDFITENIVIEYLETMKTIIILDGFDEIPTNYYKEIIIKNIRRLCAKINKSRIILTSRTGEFYYSIENTSEYEIKPFNDKQIKKFIKKWFKYKPQEADRCFKQLINSPYYDTTIRPLNLAHLCAIFEREKRIPEKPKTIYNKIVRLLIEEWNKQNSIHQESRFSDFECDRKEDFLAHLSYELTVRNHKSVFCKDDLLTIAEEIYYNFGFEKKEIYEILNEIESHNGILIKAGYEKYEYPHKSIQEYLTARFLMHIGGKLPDFNILTTIPNEMAIYTAMSQLPTYSFVEFIVSNIEDLLLSPKFLITYLNRLNVEKVDLKDSLIIGILFSFIHTSFFQNCFTFTPKAKKWKVVRTLPEQREILDTIDVFKNLIKKSIIHLKGYNIEVREMNIEYDDCEHEYIFFKHRSGNWNISVELKKYSDFLSKKVPQELVMKKTYFY